MCNKILIHCLFMFCGFFPAGLSAATSLDIQISPEVEVNLQQYGNDGNDLLLWLPSESGLLEQEKKVAQVLAKAGHPVWLADALSAWFLPALPSSIEALPAADLAILVEKIRLLSKKRVFLIANGRGALLSLRVARAWQQRYGQDAQLGGVILISPKLYVETPEPGMPGELLPVVRQTNLPVFIIQPANSPWRWKLDRMVPALEAAGSDVFTRVLADVRDRFYYRPDATDEEDSMAQSLPTLLRQATRLLASYNNKPRPVKGQRQGQEQQQQARVSPGKKERLLRAYVGDPQPPELQLDTLQGKSMALDALRGKVVLVNFWASWCPPCVHEMPSMQKLADHFSSKPFEILAVNMAEDVKTVQSFLQQKVQVRFPILMDVDGQALKRWQVFAFPTSYVIDKEGQIRLALFGAIDWMQDDVMQKLSKLLDE
jgi:thiol-disulfide isomerase/thioredoxin